MKYFQFKAINRNGDIQSGTMAAINIADLDDRLSQCGLDLLHCRVPIVARLQSVFHTLLSRTALFRTALFRSSQQAAAADSLYARQQLSMSRKDLIHFTFNLEQLLSAGVPLRDALADFASGSADDTQQNTRTVTSRLIVTIDSGKQLSDACALLPAVFSPLYISMVKVGEQTGNLAEVMHDLGALLRWNDETVARIQRVLIYPAFVSLVLLLVIVFVMTWLVPGLMSFLTSTGGELPWHSKALIAVSDSIVAHGFVAFLLTCVVACVVIVGLKRNEKLELRWHQAVLRIPLIGSVLFHIKLARFCRCAALMYSSGVSLLDSLKQCELVLDNRYLAMEVARIRKHITEGSSVSDCFARSKVFPSMIARMVRVGESTGAMEKSFDQISYFYDRHSSESIEKLEQSIGPALIMVVGGVMLWVVVSVIGPIYDLVFSMGASF